jgi:hypothetical protein
MNRLIFRYEGTALAVMLLSVFAGCAQYDDTETTEKLSVYEQRLMLNTHTIWNESFSVPGKGIWGDGAGNIISDFNDILNWTLQYSNIQLSNTGDYAKTVATSGGRFEVCDMDGEVCWKSEIIDISGFEKINIRLDARETGSNKNTETKYLKALYIIDNNAEIPFETNGESAGNWGSAMAEQKGISGKTLQIAVYISNSYASDKVILDEIVVSPEEKVYQAARPGDLLINEVLFNPYPGGEDFVEIYNISDNEFPLNKYFLASRDNDLELTQIYSLAGRNYLLPPQSYIAITKDTNAVYPYYFIECRDCFQQVERMPSYNNDEDYIVLLNENMEIIDEFHYTENMHHPLLADVNGISLERISATQNADVPGNWASASTRAGYATPGYKNSQWGEGEIHKPQVTFSPEAFSPNSDGYNDKYEISFKLDKPGYAGSINIFDAKGRLVLNLANNNIVRTGDVFVWDGKNGTGQQQPVGIYSVAVEIFNSYGRVFTFKNSVALTGVW